MLSQSSLIFLNQSLPNKAVVVCLALQLDQGPFNHGKNISQVQKSFPMWALFHLNNYVGLVFWRGKSVDVLYTYFDTVERDAPVSTFMVTLAFPNWTLTSYGLTVIVSVPVQYKPNPSAFSLFVEFLYIWKLELMITSFFWIELTIVYARAPEIVGSSLERTFRQSGLAYWTSVAFLLKTIPWQVAVIKTMCFATTRFTLLRNASQVLLRPPVLWFSSWMLLASSPTGSPMSSLLALFANEISNAPVACSREVSALSPPTDGAAF